ncbi:MAG: TetR family transcriptional regulator, partial [Halioglobus sp.]|nr:TetR family transcriptional regulator [Halioglobus sp.]
MPLMAPSAKIKFRGDGSPTEPWQFYIKIVRWYTSNCFFSFSRGPMVASNRASAAKQAGTRPARGEHTRLKILDAALDIMIEDGMRAVRHRAVARRAGVALGS